ncbi:MAG: DUF3667 domain-containing protein [Cyclobacteriaceae bacterium]
MSSKKLGQKTPQCLNCGLDLKDTFEYCPDCSQKNRDSHITFKSLIVDFFSNYFSLDSRFGRTFKPFFIQPGELTTEFMEGRRVKYANPIRLYLVISVLHFFIVSLIPNDDAEEPVFQVSDKNEIPDSGLMRLNISESMDSIYTDNENEILDEGKNTGLTSAKEIELIIQLTELKTFSRNEIQDSLRVDEMPMIKGYIMKQFIKLQMSDSESVQGYIIKNIPILMFLLLPIYALILKLFFRKKLYIHHLIHSIHLHSFMFTVLSIVWFLTILMGNSMEIVRSVAFILLTIYTFISFRKNYERSRWKTFFILLGSGSLYSFVLLTGILVEMLISLMVF